MGVHVLLTLAWVSCTLVLATLADTRTSTIETLHHGGERFEPQQDKEQSLSRTVPPPTIYDSSNHGAVYRTGENLHNIQDNDDGDVNHIRTRRHAWFGQRRFGSRLNNARRTVHGLVRRKGRGLVGLIGHLASKWIGHRTGGRSNRHGTYTLSKYVHRNSYDDDDDGDDDDKDYNYGGNDYQSYQGTEHFYRTHIRATLKGVLDHFDFNTSPIFKRDYCYEGFEHDLLSAFDTVRGFGVQTIHDFLAHASGLKMFLTRLLRGNIVRPSAIARYRGIQIAIMNILRRSQHGELFQRVTSYGEGGYQDIGGYGDPHGGHAAPHNGYVPPHILREIYASNNGYLPQNNGYFPQHNGYVPQNNGYGPQNNGYVPQNNGYVPQNNGFVPQNNGQLVGFPNPNIPELQKDSETPNDINVTEIIPDVLEDPPLEPAIPVEVTPEALTQDPLPESPGMGNGGFGNFNVDLSTGLFSPKK